MKCYVCGGEMEIIHKDVKANWKGRRVVFCEMKAWVCKSCGEQAYEPDDVRLMQNLMLGMELGNDHP